MSVPSTEGKDGVPLRFPRPVTALIATGTAAIVIGLCAMPASADQVRHSEWWLSSLDVTAAWAASQGSGVTVAVLSDGVDASHADLAGAVVAAPSPAGAPVALGQYFGEQGTAIASLIAGRGHGSGAAAGIIGVAPEARILSVPVTLPPDDPQLGQSSVAAAIPGAIATGILYAVRHGATVIDLPIDPGQAASSGTGGAIAAAGGSAAEQKAVSYALAHNVVLVAPAGDDEFAGDAPNYPAAYHGVIAVGAFDSAFNKAPWSSHQSYVTLTAAGAGVVAADSAGGYQTMNSTSAASAVVAGVVALIRSRYPSLTVADVRQVLITTTTYRRADGLANGSGYGAVNTRGAMTAAAALATPQSDRASAGAQPHQAPVAVPTQAATRGIGSQILRASEISGGLLILLLLLIAGYALSGRRRSRKQPAVTTEWTHRQAQSRYPQAGGADADRMLELFAAPAVAPASPASPVSPVSPVSPAATSASASASAAAGASPHQRHGAQPARPSGGASWDDEGLFARTAGRQPGELAAQRRGEPPVASPTLGGAPDVGGWPSHGPASRAVSGRAAVSGAPPWEPAAAPDSELPWTAAPGKHAEAAASAASSGAAPAAAPAASTAAAPVSGAWDARLRLARTGGTASGHPNAPGQDVLGPDVPLPDVPGRLSQPGVGALAGPNQPGLGARGAPSSASRPGPDRITRSAHPHQQPVGPATDLDYEPAVGVDYEPTGRGFSSPAGASPPGGYPPPSGSAVPAGPGVSQGYRSPTGSGAPAISGSATDSGWAGELGSARRFGSAGEFGSAQRFGSAGEFGSAAGFGATGGLSSSADQSSSLGYSSSADRSGASDAGYDEGASALDYSSWPDAGPAARVAPSGLPVRQPRAARPADPAPLSPGGSLWEPVSRKASAASEPSVYQAESQDAAGRPIFVWNPASTGELGE